MGKKIIVTGGAGYIGSHTVVELVQAGYEPIIVDNFSNSYPFVIKNLEKILDCSLKVYHIDCNNKEAFEEVFKKEDGIQGVIHFAAYKAVGESVANPLKYYGNNINSLVILLGLMEQYKVENLVFSSSCTVYGEPDKLPVVEDFPLKKANSPYGNTKLICESVLKETTDVAEVTRAISLRYFNPIGAHESGIIGELPIGKPNNLVPFITQTAIGKREKLTVFGDDYNTSDGTCVRDYIHVVDLAKAHVKAFEYLDSHPDKKYDVFNVGTGQGNTVLEVVRAFEEVTGVALNYELGPKRPGDVTAVYAGANKSKDELNWEADYSMKEALKHAWQWENWLKENSNELG